MAYIADIILNQQSVKFRIDQAVRHESRIEYSDGIARERLGLSEIGHSCMRYLWYRHHQYERPVPEGRILRLFRLGEVIETETIRDLESAGYCVTGRQASVSISYQGLTIRGHLDGIITGLAESGKPHILEVKSANSKSFRKLEKLRSYQDWQSKYKGQIQSYMRATGFTRALAVVYNKDNSELYTERIRGERKWTSDMIRRVFRAVRSDNPPPRHCPKRDWWEAKWCDYGEVCWYDFNQENRV